MTTPAMCGTCATLHRQDALEIKTFETVHTFHNPCAPVTQYEFRCKTCSTEWLAIEVYDEDGQRPSEWSWERKPLEPERTT